MHLNKTVLATAILLATSVCSAAEFPMMPTDFDEEVYRESYPNDPSSWSGVDWDKVGFVASGEAIDKGYKAASFLSTNSGELVTNNGTIWAVADNKSNTGYGKYVMAISASAGREGVNGKSGFIYVKADNGSLNFEAAKAMDATANEGNATKITNKGEIFVEGATGMLSTSNKAGSKSSLKNEGTITVINSGFGISLGNSDASSVEVVNSGTILASGKNAFGISASDSFNGAVVNSGTIIASDGATAISSGRWNQNEEFDLTLTGNSHVVGDIHLGDNSDLTITDLNNNEEITLKGSVRDVHVSNSDLTISSTNEDSTLSIKSVTVIEDANTTFAFNSIGSSEQKLIKIGTVTGDIGVEYSSLVADELAAGADQADLFNGLDLGDYDLDKVHVSNDGSAWGSDAIYYKDGTVQILQENTLLSSATDLAITNALMWRSQLSNLTDRMGTLRTMPETAGAWARYNGGRLDGRGIQHDYNTVEVGFDKAISNNVMLGISFDYTKGDTDLDAGTSDNNTYTLGLYGSYFNESGCFLDAMLKVGRIDTDYDLNNGISEKGDYMLTGTIVGIETGHRWNIQNYFIEPQVQLTYSYLRPENYNTNLREVKFDDMKSLIARVGIMSGMKFAEDRGSAYVKASYNHDFLGDIEGNYSGVTAAGNAVRVNIDDELDDNWGEVSLGASYQVTDSVNTFVDVGTSFGGDIDQKWRVNLGARYVF